MNPITAALSPPLTTGMSTKYKACMAALPFGRTYKTGYAKMTSNQLHGSVANTRGLNHAPVGKSAANQNAKTIIQ